MNATPLTPEIGELNETIRYLREVTDRPYLDIPLVRVNEGWSQSAGASGKQSMKLPLSEKSIAILLRIGRAALRDNTGDTATLRLHLRSHH